MRAMASRPGARLSTLRWAVSAEPDSGHSESHGGPRGTRVAPPVPSATDGSAQHNGRRRGALRPWGGRARGSPAPPRVPWALGRPHRPHPSPPDREPQAPSLLTTLVSAFDGGKRRDVAGGRQGQADSGGCRAALAAAPSLPPLPPACRGPWLQQAPTLQSCPPLAASSRPLSREPQKPCPARRLLLTPLHLQLPAPLLPRNHPGQPAPSAPSPPLSQTQPHRTVMPSTPQGPPHG